MKQLDQQQLQVDLEVILVTLSDGQSRNLGVELVRKFEVGETNVALASLFGLSTAPPGDSVGRQIGNASGFSGAVINPGDFAAVVRALETVTGGTSMIRSKVVVANNAKATVNGVVQQPLTSINSGQTVATTAVTGTTDAGTQVAITPQVSAGDQVTLTYSISQSAFLGESTTTGDGVVIPPAKRADSVASIATIPDGYVIGLGGLSNRTDTSSESGIPWLRNIPLFGLLFSNRSKTTATSRFFVFVKVDILHQRNLGDLRRRSDRQLDAAGMIQEQWPMVVPQAME